MPHSVRFRQGGWDQYNLISGVDWKADLYYAAAHLRQLIDRSNWQALSPRSPNHGTDGGSAESLQ